MQFNIRYFADPYEESRFEFFYKSEIITYHMPLDHDARYEWNETLIALLDVADKAMQLASGDKRQHVTPDRIFSVWMTDKEYQSWMARFDKWSFRVERRPDRESNLRVYLTTYEKP
ncbi:MAG: hypothetical protein IKE64_14895 [Thermoguttaceae bacterium]|nr:hypothetical protein [Thermoguttaceae bacterium]